jgi:hypothetical protein
VVLEQAFFEFFGAFPVSHPTSDSYSFIIQQEDQWTHQISQFQENEPSTGRTKGKITTNIAHVPGMCIPIMQGT